LIEAAGGVGTHQRLEPAPLDFFLECIAQRLAAVSVARAAAIPRLAAVDADKDVMRELRHFKGYCRESWLCP